MPFQTNNNFGGSPNNNQGDKKRTNFPVRRLYGSDGILDLSVWNSDSSVYTIFQIKQAIGKDPSTGANAYEQKAPSELPRVFLNPEYLRAFYDAAKSADINNLNLSISPKRGSKMTVVGSGSQVKITVETEKQGSRSVTFEGIPVGNSTVNASWKNLITVMEIALKKALRSKLDPDEFAMALFGDSDDEAPI